MCIELFGNWEKGLAFAEHTLRSTYLGVNELGYDKWDNERTEMGELIYKLKYKSDLSVLNRIIVLLDKIKGIDEMDYIIPIPSTKDRDMQPVVAIAKEIGKRNTVEVLENILEKNYYGPPIKDIDNCEKRIELLRNSMQLGNNRIIKGKNLLLVDDLYRSGATLRVATDLLYKQGEAKGVYVLTMTKTRSKR